MHTKALSVLLTLCMIVGLIPWATLPARATGADGTSAETAFLIGGESEAAAWENLKNALKGDAEASVKRATEDADHPTYYKLTANCVSGNPTGGGFIEVGSGRFVVLDLNSSRGSACRS